MLGLALITSLMSAPTIAADAVCQRIGVNVTSASASGTEMAFSDLAVTAAGWRRPWGSPNLSVPISVDKFGNPLSIAPDTSLVNVIHNDKWDRSSNETTYRLTWEGSGSVSPAVRYKILKTGPNELIFDNTIKPGANFWLNMTATSQTNPVRNVKLVPIKYVNSTDYVSLEKGKFRQRFVDSLNHFSILRFMDWNATNNNPIKEWAERRSLGDVNYSDGKGLSYEDMIDLANATGKDLWVNVPVSASDDYVAKMAKLFSTRLNPDRTVYVEYTNEAWNTLFSQYKIINDWAVQKGIKQPEAYADRALEAYADRALEVFAIWRQNFSRPSQVKVILAGQFNNPWIAKTILARNDAGHKVDGIAIAPYTTWTPVEWTAMTDWLMTATPATLIARLKTDVMPRFKDRLASHATLAKQYGIPLVAYEGGQHLVGPTGLLRDNQTVTDLLINTNRSAYMTDLYMSILSEWSRAGGGPFVFFTQVNEFSKWGSWGLKESGAKSATDSPKLKGIYQYCGWTQ